MSSGQAATRGVPLGRAQGALGAQAVGTMAETTGSNNDAGRQPGRLLVPDRAALAMALFALATLTPAVLILAGVVFGGGWAMAALLFVTLVVAGMDRVAAIAAPHVPDAAEFPAADRLCVALALAHLLLLPLVVWAVSGDSGLSVGARLALLAGAGLWFGQVGNSNAHELIHRSDRWLFRLGVAVYVSLLFGHHASAHRHVHHRFVASDDDPNSARRGEGFYRFLLRAWPGSLIAGYEIERAMRRQAGATRRWRPHPYVWYMGGAVAVLAGMGLAFGLAGLAVYLVLALHAQAQLLLSDYVQHYGLERRHLPGGRLEPVGPGHSWNSGHWASSALMLNAPRHSDHHAHPARPYPALTLSTDTPRLPHSLPVMAVIALWPPLWRRIMNPLLPKP